MPTIALVPAGTVFRTRRRWQFEVGCPGRDHDAMLFDPALGAIAFAAASAPRGHPQRGRHAGRDHGGVAVMLTRLTGGRIIDPANGRDDVGDLWVQDGRIVPPPITPAPMRRWT